LFHETDNRKHVKATKHRAKRHAMLRNGSLLMYKTMILTHAFTHTRMHNSYTHK